MTGRTTAAALRLIADAIDKPEEYIVARDHHDTRRMSEYLAKYAIGMASKLGLEHMSIREYAFGYWAMVFSESKNTRKPYIHPDILNELSRRLG